LRYINSDDKRKRPFYPQSFFFFFIFFEKLDLLSYSAVFYPAEEPMY